jgi:hypothetical protein
MDLRGECKYEGAASAKVRFLLNEPEEIERYNLDFGRGGGGVGGWGWGFN